MNRYNIVTVQAYLDAPPRSLMSRTVRYCVADAELANQCVTNKHDTREGAAAEFVNAHPELTTDDVLHLMNQATAHLPKWTANDGVKE